MRTYGRDAFMEARGLWKSGEYGPEWESYRQLAAERGFIYPPNGTKWDSWEDDEPSQRAILYRAIEDTPKMLTQAILASRSWNDVVRKVVAGIEVLREDADFRERQTAWDRQDEPNPRQATATIANILGRIQDSRP